MEQLKKCCSSADCEHEISVNFDKSRGWVICTNSNVYARIIESYRNESAVLSYSELAPNQYSQLRTHNLRIIRNIISDLEK